MIVTAAHRLAISVGGIVLGALAVVLVPVAVVNDVAPFGDDDKEPEVLGSQVYAPVTFPEVIVIEIRQATTTTTTTTSSSPPTTAPPVTVPPTDPPSFPTAPPFPIDPVPTTTSTVPEPPPVPAPIPVPEPAPLPEPVDDALGQVLGYIADTPRRGRFGEIVRNIAPGRQP